MALAGIIHHSVPRCAAPRCESSAATRGKKEPGVLANRAGAHFRAIAAAQACGRHPLNRAAIFLWQGGAAPLDASVSSHTCRQMLAIFLLISAVASTASLPQSEILPLFENFKAQVNERLAKLEADTALIAAQSNELRALVASWEQRLRDGGQQNDVHIQQDASDKARKESAGNNESSRSWHVHRSSRRRAVRAWVLAMRTNTGPAGMRLWEWLKGQGVQDTPHAHEQLDATPWIHPSAILVHESPEAAQPGHPAGIEAKVEAPLKLAEGAAQASMPPQGVSDSKSDLPTPTHQHPAAGSHADAPKPPAEPQRLQPLAIPDSSSGLAQFLQQIGLERYLKKLSGLLIDMHTLQQMSESDFERLPIPLGPRKKILKALRKSQKAAEAPVPSKPAAPRMEVVPKAGALQPLATPGSGGGLAQFLQQIGLERYLKRLSDEGLDIEALHRMSESDFEKLRFPLGPRKKLLKALLRSQKAAEAPVPTTGHATGIEAKVEAPLKLAEGAAQASTPPQGVSGSKSDLHVPTHQHPTMEHPTAVAKGNTEGAAGSEEAAKDQETRAEMQARVRLEVRAKMRREADEKAEAGKAEGCHGAEGTCDAKAGNRGLRGGDQPPADLGTME